MKKRWIGWGCLLFLFFSSLAYGQEKCALVIGVNGENHFWDQLFYAEKDALAIRTALVKQLGFRSDRVELLLGKSATKKAVEKAFLQLTSRAKGGRPVVIYFAGLGTLEAKEGKSWEEALILAENQMITVSELRSKIATLAPSPVFLLLDTWFAGPSPKSTYFRPRFLPAKGAPTRWDHPSFLQWNRSHLALLTARKAIELPSLQHGLLTSAFLEALRGRADKDENALLEASEAVQWIQGRIKARGFSQKLLFLGEKKQILARLKPTIQIRLDKKGPWIDGGKSQGLSMATLFEIRSGPGKIKGLARVVELLPNRARLQPTTSGSLSPGDYAICLGLPQQGLDKLKNLQPHLLSPWIEVRTRGGNLKTYRSSRILDQTYLLSDEFALDVKAIRTCYLTVAISYSKGSKTYLLKGPQQALAQGETLTISSKNHPLLQLTHIAKTLSISKLSGPFVLNLTLISSSFPFRPSSSPLSSGDWMAQLNKSARKSLGPATLQALSRTKGDDLILRGWRVVQVKMHLERKGR